MVKRLVILLIVLGGVFGALFGFKFHQMRQQAAQMATPPPPATVASATVQARSWQPYLYSVGSVVADNEVFVANEVDGIVTRITFDSGKQVNKGDLLVQLDDSVDQADLEGLTAQRQLAQLEFTRSAKLLKDRSVSRSDYDRNQSSLQAADANVKSKRAVINKKAIRAPFSGVLGIRQINLGQYLPAGSNIVSLQALDPIHVDYTVPERHLARLRVDQTVEVSLQAYPDNTFRGQVTAIDPRIDRRTRNVQVRATFSNPEHRLQPGMFAQVHTLLPRRDEVLTVPQTAVTYNPYGESVFVIQEQEDRFTVQRRQVQTGTVRDGQVEVEQGIALGEKVVSAGQVKLRNGQEVRIDNSVTLEARAGTQ